MIAQFESMVAKIGTMVVKFRNMVAKAASVIVKFESVLYGKGLYWLSISTVLTARFCLQCRPFLHSDKYSFLNNIHSKKKKKIGQPNYHGELNLYIRTA